MTGHVVGDVMTQRVAAARKATPFKEIARILAEWRVSAMPVLDETDRVVGLVSEADLLPKEEYRDAIEPHPFMGRHERHERAKAAGDTAGQLMTSPAVTVHPDVSVAEAARKMERCGVKRLVVVDGDDHLVGIVTRADLLKVFLRSDDEIREEIVRDVFMRVLWADPEAFDVQVRDGVVVLTGELQTRSSVPLAVRLTRAVDGVVDVVDKLGYVVDDSPRPDFRFLHRP
jgi:CBS domain-containing protein